MVGGKVIRVDGFSARVIIPKRTACEFKLHLRWERYKLNLDNQSARKGVQR